MKAVGIVTAMIGLILGIGTIGTDDFYTMELHQYHAFDWKGFIIAGVLVAVGLLIYWIDDNFYIHVGRKHES